MIRMNCIDDTRSRFAGITAWDGEYVGSHPRFGLGKLLSRKRDSSWFSVVAH